MGRRSRSRQVEIFNFSFLDILACTIGLLIFIMVMVFILQSGSPVADQEYEPVPPDAVSVKLAIAEQGEAIGITLVRNRR